MTAPPGFYEDYIDKGFDALESGNPEVAVRAFQQALRMRARDAEATCYLGLAYYKQGNFVAALEQFEKAMVIDPFIADSPVLFYRAMCLRQLGLRGMERRAWTRLIELDPKGRFALKGHKAIADLDRSGSAFATDEAWRAMFKKVIGSKDYRAWQVYPHVAVLFYMEALFSKMEKRKDDTEPLANLLHGLNITGRPDVVVEFENLLLLERKDIPEPIFLDLAIARVTLGNCAEADRYLKRIGPSSFQTQAQTIQAICDQVHDQFKQQISLEGQTFRLYNYSEAMHRDLTRQAVIPDGAAP